MESKDGACTLRVKVVPGARHSRVVGMLGDRLKLTVSAPPEAGKANKAVCRLLAEALGMPSRDLSVTAGHTQPVKTLTLTGVDVEQAVARLTEYLDGQPCPSVSELS